MRLLLSVRIFAKAVAQLPLPIMPNCIATIFDEQQIYKLMIACISMFYFMSPASLLL
jgi:hypothetical protein